MSDFNIIKIKRGLTGGVIPTGLTYGEIAVNITDKRLFVGGYTGNTIELLGSTSEGGGFTFGDIPKATTGSTPGIATFQHTHFAVSSTGHVELALGYQVTGDTVVQGSGISISRAGNSVTISASAVPASREVLATTSLTGIASFDPRFFSVSTTGHVVLSSGYSATGDTVVQGDGIFVARNGSTVTISGFTGSTGDTVVQGTGISISRVGNSVTINAATVSTREVLATTSLTGIASFDPRYFIVSGTGHVGLTSSYQVTGDTVVQGTGVSVVRSGNTVTISASGGSAESTWTNTEAGYINGIASGITFGVGSNAIQVLEQLIYPYQPVSLSNFSVGLASNTFDLGQTSAAGSYNSSWNSSGPAANWVSGSLVISIVSGSNLASGLNYNSSPYSISHAAYMYNTPSTLSFSLTGQQVGGVKLVTTSNKTYSWLHRIYWGKSASATLSSISNITTGSSNRYTSSTTSLGNYTYTFSSSASAEYCYVVVPTSPGSPGTYTSWRDTNNLSFTPVEGTFTETNSHGVSVSWKWYQVANPTTGTFSASASS